MKVTMLGCGSSAGVPLIGCKCPVCTGGNPKNNRTRVSVLVEVQGKNILIDTSPDLRQQALRHGITRIDAVLYTHEHADHTHGIDELRSFNYLAKESIPIYGRADLLDTLKSRFAYAFLPKPDNFWFRPSLTPHALKEAPVYKFDLFGIPITSFEQWHGESKTIGYRIGNFAYSTDTDNIPEESFAVLDGLEAWIVDCLRYSESRSHSNFKRTVGWIERVKPKLAVLTHLAHDFDYETLSRELPLGAVPGYDGLTLETQ